MKNSSPQLVYGCTHTEKLCGCMCIYVCKYGVCTSVCVGMHACVCVCFQKPGEDTECPVLSFFAVFLSDWVSHQTWSLTGDQQAPVILLFPLSLLFVVTSSLKIGLQDLNPGPGLLQQVVLPIMLSFQHLVHLLQVKRPSKYSCFTPRKQFSGANKKMRPGSDCNDGAAH